MFCWQCSRSLDPTIHTMVCVDGHTVRVHYACAPLAEADEHAARITRQPADEVPELIRRYPEVRYG